MTDQNDIMQQEQPGGLTTLSSSGAATYGYTQPGPGATGTDDGKNGKNGKKRKKGNKGGKALVGVLVFLIVVLIGLCVGGYFFIGSHVGE